MRIWTYYSQLCYVYIIYTFLFRPSYMHFWQLKSFWHDAKVYRYDIATINTLYLPTLALSTILNWWNNCIALVICSIIYYISILSYLLILHTIVLIIHIMQLCMDDIEHHSFEDIGMVPAVSIAESTDRYVNLVAAEAIRFRNKVSKCM